MKINKQTIIKSGVFVLPLLFLPLTALAVQLSDPLHGASVPVIIGRVIKVAVGLSGSAALLMFVYGGFIWMFSGGDKERITKGRKTLVWAAIGMVVIFAAYMAVELIILAISEGATT